MSFESDRKPSLVERVRRAAAWPFRVAATRATLNALAAMDGRELADIGLTRSDLRDVSALALDHDPTALLARRAQERRRNAFAPPTAPSRGEWPWDQDRRAFGSGHSNCPAPVSSAGFCRRQGLEGPLIVASDCSEQA